MNSVIQSSFASDASFESATSELSATEIGPGTDRINKVNNDSFGSRALFSGREVSNDFKSFWKEVYESSGHPFGLIGGALGGAVGYLGGAVYKAGMHALGRGAPTRPLSDYAVSTALKGFEALSQIGRVLLSPVTAALAFGFSVAGVVGAVLGTTVSVVTAPVYKLVQHLFGDETQNKRLSDYVIDSAAIGARVGMVTAAVAGLTAGIIFCGWTTLFCLLGLLGSMGCTIYVDSNPTWLAGRRNEV